SLVPRMPLIDRISQRVSLDEGLAVLPVIVVRTAQENAKVQINVDEIVRHQLPIHDNAWRDIHSTSPIGHVFIRVVANVWLIPRTPAAQQRAAMAYSFVAGHRLVEEVK